jgi:hypothetical protein
MKKASKKAKKAVRSKKAGKPARKAKKAVRGGKPGRVFPPAPTMAIPPSQVAS